MGEFTMGIDGSKVEARYSFNYVFEDGEWKISHHHSSAMPEGLLAAANKISEMETTAPPVITKKEVADLFHFLKRKPQGVVTQRKILLKDGVCQDAGVYEFTMGIDGSKVAARYTFTYIFEDGEWKIAHHHSSAMPEPLIAAATKNLALID